MSCIIASLTNDSDDNTLFSRSTVRRRHLPNPCAHGVELHSTAPRSDGGLHP